MPDETLQLGRSIGQLTGGSAEDLVGLRLVHVVGLTLAPLVQLVPLYEGATEWVEFLELEVARRLVVAQSRGNGQVLGTSVEDNPSRLTFRRSHVDSAHINGIVSGQKRHLQSQVVLVVLV